MCTPDQREGRGTTRGTPLKLYVCGHLNRIRSSRRPEVETRPDLEVVRLARQLRPDFRTAADFRHDSRQAFRQVFRRVVCLSREHDLNGRELLAADGTRVKPLNNHQCNFTRGNLCLRLKKLYERLERQLKEMYEADAQPLRRHGFRRPPFHENRFPAPMPRNASE